MLQRQKPNLSMRALAYHTTRRNCINAKSLLNGIFWPVSA